MPRLSGHVGGNRCRVCSLVGLHSRLRGFHVDVFAEVEDCVMSDEHEGGGGGGEHGWMETG